MKVDEMGCFLEPHNNLISLLSKISLLKALPLLNFNSHKFKDPLLCKTALFTKSKCFNKNLSRELYFQNSKECLASLKSRQSQVLSGSKKLICLKMSQFKSLIRAGARR